MILSQDATYLAGTDFVSQYKFLLNEIKFQFFWFSSYNHH